MLHTRLRRSTPVRIIAHDSGSAGQARIHRPVERVVERVLPRQLVVAAIRKLINKRPIALLELRQRLREFGPGLGRIKSSKNGVLNIGSCDDARTDLGRRDGEGPLAEFGFKLLDAVPDGLGRVISRCEGTALGARFGTAVKESLCVSSMLDRPQSYMLLV